MKNNEYINNYIKQNYDRITIKVKKGEKKRIRNTYSRFRI